MRIAFLLLMVCILGMGCANCKSIEQQLDTCQKTLSDQDLIIKTKESTIRQKDQEIKEKEDSIKKLELQVIELNRRMTITSSEKGVYDERIKKVSSLVRDFIKEQIQANREFLTKVELEDFIGNELIAREYSGESGILVIDIENPVPSDGQINGIGGYFLGPTEVIVKLLRPMGNDYIITDSQKLSFEIEKAGKTYVDFENPLIVKKDDIVAFYFSKSVTAPYDSGLGTSAYLSIKDDIYENGGRIPADDLFQKNQIKRKYSLNYYGIFIQN
ncbi:MAG: hypothetical protein MUE70_06860 [Desulfobacterales bacterium]|nr:hypothetical protein [Desulfobacterales bacterium]